MVAIDFLVRACLQDTYLAFVGDVPTDDNAYLYAYFSGGEPAYVGSTTHAEQRAGEHFKRSPLKWTVCVDEVQYSEPMSGRAARQQEHTYAFELTKHIGGGAAHSVKSESFKHACANDPTPLPPSAQAALEFWEDFSSPAARWKCLKDHDGFSAKADAYAAKFPDLLTVYRSGSLDRMLAKQTTAHTSDEL